MAKRKGLSGGGSRARKRERKLRKLDWYSIKRNNQKAGHHYFDADTMRFFSSRVGSNIHKGATCAYFITSEKGRHQGARRYSVRKTCDGGGTVKTVGEFQQYASRAGAEAAAKRLAKAEKGKA